MKHGSSLLLTACFHNFPHYGPHKKYLFGENTILKIWNESIFPIIAVRKSNKNSNYIIIKKTNSNFAIKYKLLKGTKERIWGGGEGAHFRELDSNLKRCAPPLNFHLQWHSREYLQFLKVIFLTNFPVRQIFHHWAYFPLIVKCYCYYLLNVISHEN